MGTAHPSWTAALLLAAAACPAAISCGPNIAEGTTRALSKEGRAGLVAVQGTEIFTDGEWQKTGEFVFYDEGGEEIGRGSYKDGREDGPWTQKYDDGSTGVGNFQAGTQSGPWKTFHKNGKLQDGGTYARGRREGTWFSLRKDGSRLREAEYVNGALNGRVTWYAKDGITVDKNRSGIYEDGELTAK